MENRQLFSHTFTIFYVSKIVGALIYRTNDEKRADNTRRIQLKRLPQRLQSFIASIRFSS